MLKKLFLSWSSGKDCAMALHELQKSQEYEVVGLLTTVTEDYDRISMHGVRRDLLRQQASAIGLPLIEVNIGKDSSGEEYQTLMRDTLTALKFQGVCGMAIGDIFLEDLRQYRESKLAELGMEAVFPLWKRDTGELANSFIAAGFKAIITCVDTQILDGRFSGREFNADFLAEISPIVDPCGENGEFHTFVYDGPIFKEAVAFTKGEVVLRDGRYNFCDLVPTES